MKNLEILKESIRNIPDFPKKGINFKDITTLLQDKNLFRQVLEMMCLGYSQKRVDKVIGIESRGFILGSAIAYKLNAGFIPIRKKGKLPYKTYEITYDLEYGSDTLEIHTDSISKGENVIIIDDLLATGGTAQAALELVRKTKAEVLGVNFLIELSFLKGREKLKEIPVFSLVKFD